MVGLGGGAGSLLRYLSGRIFLSQTLSSTLFVNVLGSLLVGILITLSIKNNWDSARQLLFITGFCGGFTTFSAFSLQNLELLQQQRYFESIAYIFASLFLSILAVYAGFILAK